MSQVRGRFLVIAHLTICLGNVESGALPANGRSMLVCGARPQPERLMREAGFDRHIGSQNIFENIGEALKRAAEIYNKKEALAGAK